MKSLLGPYVGDVAGCIGYITAVCYLVNRGSQGAFEPSQ